VKPINHNLLDIHVDCFVCEVAISIYIYILLHNESEINVTMERKLHKHTIKFKNKIISCMGFHG
jgi:hypothetical protein